jgi:O-antigen/teichoic acid export membrane protein
VQRHLGTHELGVFAAVAAFLAAGSTVANALGQSTTPRLARYYSEGDLGEFRRLVLRLTGLVVLLGVAGVLVSALLGGFLLRVVYHPDYARYGGLLVGVMAAGICVYVAVVLGYVITSARSFLVQMPLLGTVAATSAIASWLLVPHLGLNGAVLAVAIAASVQIAGEVLILRGALRRVEEEA